MSRSAHKAYHAMHKGQSHLAYLESTAGLRERQGVPSRRYPPRRTKAKRPAGAFGYKF